MIVNPKGIERWPGPARPPSLLPRNQVVEKASRRRSTSWVFAHICGRTRKGHFTVLRQTMRQRQQAKLQALKEELRRRMHTPIGEQGDYLRAVLNGHFRYYGVPMNGPALSSFHGAVGRLWWRTCDAGVRNPCQLTFGGICRRVFRADSLENLTVCTATKARK
jgi:hypothetical protein